MPSKAMPEKFKVLKKALKQRGWYVGWNLSCCQTCAWYDVPDDADFSKVLFNHAQDIERGFEDGSMFCFDGNDEGVKNLKEILPIIEECGCTYSWDGTGDSRIEINW